MCLCCLLLFFIHLKLNLLTQFPASNDENYFKFMKNKHYPYWLIWFLSHLSRTISVMFHLNLRHARAHIYATLAAQRVILVMLGSYIYGCKHVLKQILKSEFVVMLSWANNPNLRDACFSSLKIFLKLDIATAIPAENEWKNKPFSSIRVNF